MRAGARQGSRWPGAAYCPWEEEQGLSLEGVLASEIVRVENKVSFCLVLHGSFIFFYFNHAHILYILVLHILIFQQKRMYSLIIRSAGVVPRGALAIFCSFLHSFL